MHQVRAVTLTGYLEVAAFVGLDGRRMLREAGLSPDRLNDPENRLPAREVSQLLERSAAASGCENFGLLMAEGRTFASLGPISLLLERLPNLREVVRAATAFQRHLNDVVSIAWEDDGAQCLIRFDLEPRFWSPQVGDLVAGLGYRMLWAASGNRWKPDSVHLMRETPGDLSAWRRFFPAPIEFAAASNALSSTLSAMAQTLPLADAEMARHAKRLLQMVPIDPDPAVTSDRVRRVITLLLPSGGASLDNAAAQLSVTPRTLQRELAREGHRFADLLAAVRRELATAYLASPSRPVTTVAAMLGYASTSSFIRWFGEAFGMAPQAWRARQQRGEDGQSARKR